MNVTRIGLLNEKPLHASLREWCHLPGDEFEASVDGYVIDIVRGELLVEIQTGAFASIKSKLKDLTISHEVRLVYPIALEKWILKKVKAGGDTTTRRKSPRRGRVEDLFWEMVHLSGLIGNRNFSLEVLLIREEVVKKFDRGRNWRNGGWGVEERRLLEVVDQRLFQSPSDWRALLPDGIEAFTARELAEQMSISLRLAQKMAYCLREANVIQFVGKRGRAHIYRVVGANPV